MNSSWLSDSSFNDPFEFSGSSYPLQVYHDTSGLGEDVLVTAKRAYGRIDRPSYSNHRPVRFSIEEWQSCWCL